VTSDVCSMAMTVLHSVVLVCILKDKLLKFFCRWGPNGVTAYKDNMVKLMKLFKNSLPVETLVIWTTVPPISTTCSGALLVKQVRNV
jgi:hypothetical protein